MLGVLLMARTSFITGDDGELCLEVVLSERNLWALLTKLYTPGSACEITNNDCPAEIRVVRLRSEHDWIHYKSETRGLAQGFAGAMHPVTEAITARVRPVIRQAVAEIGGIADQGPASE